jgi:hypothetical protein
MKTETTIIIIFLLITGVCGCLSTHPQNDQNSLKDNISGDSVRPSTTPYSDEGQRTQQQADSPRPISPARTPTSDILQPTTEYFGGVNSLVEANETVEGTWIRIDPIPDYHSGDKFFINGSTNLPEGSQINIEGAIDCYGCCSKAGCGERGDFTGIAKIENIRENSRNWSFTLNTVDFPPQLYIVYAFNNNTRSMANFRILEKIA